MDDFLIQLRRSRDAWFMLSWMIFPENERGSADPDKLLRLADALDHRGVEDGARDWPNALRYIARRWRSLLDRPRAHLMRCPRCGGEDLRVSAELVFRVAATTAEGDGAANLLVSVEGAEPYWDGNNICICQTCELEGRVRDFEPEITVHALHCIALVYEQG